MAIGAAGWAMINVAMTKASPKLLARTGPAVSKLIGKPVQATATSIMGALRNWAANNPKKFLIATNLLAAIGFDIAADGVVDVVGDLIDDPEVAALLSEVQATIVSERSHFTGDGSPDSVHGVPTDEYMKSVERLSFVHNTIRKGVQATGSLSALLALRACVYLEDADFESFKMMRY